MAGGRPRKFENEAELESRVNEYFIHIKGERKKDADGKDTDGWERYPEPATVTGLAIFLGFESRQSIYDYDKEGEFSYIIKIARLRVECEYEKRLTTAQSATGAIFALKNMGWRDKVETGITDNEGNDVPVTIFEIPHNGRNQYQTKDNQAAGGVSDEGTQQPS